MANHWQWVKRFILATGLFVLMLVLFNLLVDPNGVFGIVSIRGFNKHKTDILNDRITKFYYVRRFSPDTLLLGSSRAALLDPDDLKKYTKDRVFNLGINASTIYQQYCYFKYVSDRYPLKNVVIGVDLLSFIASEEENREFDTKRLTRSVYFKDYTDSLFNLKAVELSYQTVKKNVREKNLLQDDRVGFKGFSHPAEEDDRRYPARRVRRENVALKVFSNVYLSGVYNHPDRIRNNLGYLREIVRIAKQKNIQFIMYVSPVSAKLFDLMYATGVGRYSEEWKRGLVRIANFHDFSGRNPISENPQWWREPSHIITDGGKLIFARLYGDSSVAVPDDFGILVTEKNIESHLAVLRKSAQPVDLQSIVK